MLGDYLFIYLLTPPCLALQCQEVQILVLFLYAVDTTSLKASLITCEALNNQ